MMPLLRPPLAVEGGVAVIGSSPSGRSEHVVAQQNQPTVPRPVGSFASLGSLSGRGLEKPRKGGKIDDSGCQSGASSLKMVQPKKVGIPDESISVAAAVANSTDSSMLGIVSAAIVASSLKKATGFEEIGTMDFHSISVAAKSKKSKQTPGERLKRSRERNRMHARKTRQRKKEHMQNLQNRADDLKKEQIRLRQTINEKNTASILAGMFSIDKQKPLVAEDPRIESLLQRSVEDIPDSSKIPELPALILPGAHNSKKTSGKLPVSETNCEEQKLPDDGIDYELLGKDRAKCSPAELDKIRRERNRMHAKRTRDRKRIFMEEMEELIKKLESENDLLMDHLRGMGVDPQIPALVSPNLAPSSPEKDTLPQTNPLGDQHSKAGASRGNGQLKSLLDAVGSITENAAAPTTTVVSSNSSCDDTFSNDGPSSKRRKTNEPVPSSITTTAGAATQSTTESGR